MGATTIKLYGYWRSAATYRVRIALALKGLAWTETAVDVAAGEQFTREFAARNPQHAVPVLLDGGTPLTQSLAIIEYLEERYPEPPLLPKALPERAAVRAFALISIADAHPLQVPRVRRYLMRELAASEAATRAWARHWFEEAFAAMQAQLVARERDSAFCFGDTPGLADIALAAHAAGAATVDVAVEDYPRLAAILERCQQLDAFALNSPQALAPRVASGT